MGEPLISPTSQGNDGSKSRVWNQLIQAIAVDRMSSIPPVEQIQSSIRHHLATGRIPVGTRMPSTRTLAAAIGVTAATVGRAYVGLQAEGLLASTIGVGTTVVDIKHLSGTGRDHMLRAGNAVLADAIGALRRLGYSGPDLRAALISAAEGLAQTLTAVFVATRGSSLNIYVAQLRRELAGLPVSIEALTLEDLETDSGRAAIDRSDLILTTLTYKRHLDRTLPERADSVIVMLSELSASVTDELIAIASDAKIVLISKPLSRPIALGILQSHGLREQLSVAVDLEPEALHEFCHGFDVFVHTTDITDLVAELAGSAIRIPLRMNLRPESIEALREHFHSTALDRTLQLNEPGTTGP